MAKYLFVGGPADGKRDEVENPQWPFKVYALPGAFMALDEEGVPSPNSLSVNFHLYEPRRFAHGEKRHTIFCHESLRDADLMEVLIGGYHSHAFLAAGHRVI